MTEDLDFRTCLKNPDCILQISKNYTNSLTERFDRDLSLYFRKESIW